MKKRMVGLIYLLARSDKQNITTASIHKIANKIPCQQEEYYKLTLTESYVLKQMCQYPTPLYHKEDLYDQEEPHQEDPDEDTKIADLLINLPCDLSYLEVEEARDWLKQLDREQLRRNKENLKLLQRHLQESLEDGCYQKYIEESVIALIVQLRCAQKSSSSDLL